VEETDVSTLLIVDDEENILRSLSRLFRRQDFKVLTATSGADALEILRTTPVSVILSDQRMPGMTGADFFSQVKTLYPRTIRLIMSGYTELESITSAINDGAIFKFLLKPWDDDKLLAHIQEAMSIHQLKSHNEKLIQQLAELNRKLEQKVEAQHMELILQMRTLRISQEILHQIPVAVFGISDEGVLVEANSMAGTIPDYHSAIGMPITHVLPQALVNNYLALMDKGQINTVNEMETSLGGQKFKVLMKRFVGAFKVSGTVIVAVEA